MTRDNNVPNRPSDRSFGILFSIVSAVGAVALIRQDYRSAGVVCIGLSVAFFLLALTLPRALAGLNHIWFQLGNVLHSVISPLVLGLIFFTLITPIALLMRASGRDLLEIRRDPTRGSYWKDRIPPGPQRDSFFNQF